MPRVSLDAPAFERLCDPVYKESRRSCQKKRQKFDSFQGQCEHILDMITWIHNGGWYVCDA